MSDIEVNPTRYPAASHLPHDDIKTSLHSVLSAEFSTKEMFLSKVMLHLHPQIQFNKRLQLQCHDLSYRMRSNNPLK